jgi:hypothetical protein
MRKTSLRDGEKITDAEVPSLWTGRAGVVAKKNPSPSMGKG